MKKKSNRGLSYFGFPWQKPNTRIIFSTLKSFVHFLKHFSDVSIRRFSREKNRNHRAHQKTYFSLQTHIGTYVNLYSFERSMKWPFPTSFCFWVKINIRKISDWAAFIMYPTGGGRGFFFQRLVFLYPPPKVHTNFQNPPSNQPKN